MVGCLARALSQSSPCSSASTHLPTFDGSKARSNGVCHAAVATTKTPELVFLFGLPSSSSELPSLLPNLPAGRDDTGDGAPCCRNACSDNPPTPSAAMLLASSAVLITRSCLWPLFKPDLPPWPGCNGASECVFDDTLACRGLCCAFILTMYAGPWLMLPSCP